MKGFSKKVDRIVGKRRVDATSIELALAIASEPAGLPVLAAAGGDEGLIAFVLAKHGAELPASRHLVALWLLERSEKSAEQTTDLNLLTWLGAELRSDVELPKPLARRLSDFLVRCAGSQALPLRLAFLDLMVSRASAVELLSEPAGREVVERLADLYDDSDELTQDDVRRLERAIGRAPLATRHRTSPFDVAAAISALRRLVPAAVSRAHKTSLQHWTDRLLASEEAAYRARTRHAAVIEFSVGGPTVDLGRLGQLLQSGSNLFAEIGTELFPTDAQAALLQPIAASPGSFSIRALVEGRRARAIAEHFEDIVEQLSNGDDGLAETLPSPSVAKRLRSFLDAVAAQDGTVSTSFLGARAGQSVRRHTLDRDRVDEVREWLERGPQEDVSETTFVATLVGADLGTGTFRCRYGGAEIIGRVPDSNLLDKVKIGKVYQFHVRETVEERPIGASRVVELLSLEVPDAEEFQSTADTSVGVVPGVCVPQASLERVRQAVELIQGGAKPTPAAFGVQRQRNVDYYLAAARVLGLLDREAELTAVGKLWTRMGPRERERQLAVQLELSTVGQAWIGWANVARLHEVKPSTAERFIIKQTTLGPGTARTRAGYLRAWLAELLGHLQGESA